MNEALQRPEIVELVRTDQTDGITHGIGPAGAADPMHVIFGSRWEVEIHHMRNSVHIDAPSGDVGRHQNPHGSALEFRQGPQALVLRPIGMEGRGADPGLFEPSGDPVGTVLHAGKDQHHLHGRIQQELLEQGGLEMAGYFVHRLGHRLGGIGASSDFDRLWGLLELAGHRLDLSRQRRRKEQGLASFGQLSHDIPDGGQEAHVQHAVGLVEDQVLDTGEVAIAPGHEVQQAARRGDDDVGTPSERLDLRFFADSAKDRGHAEGQKLGVIPHIFVDLDHQFPSGCEDECADMARAGVSGRQTGQERQCERCSLAGSGLGDANEILAGEDDGNGRGLNRRRFGVAGLIDSAQHTRVQAQLSKIHFCQGIREGRKIEQRGTEKMKWERDGMADQPIRQVIRALLRSYGDISILTRSPTVRRTQRLRILPHTVAKTRC